MTFFRTDLLALRQWLVHPATPSWCLLTYVASLGVTKSLAQCHNIAYWLRCLRLGQTDWTELGMAVFVSVAYHKVQRKQCNQDSFNDEVNVFISKSIFIIRFCFVNSLSTSQVSTVGIACNTSHIYIHIYIYTYVFLNLLLRLIVSKRSSGPNNIIQVVSHVYGCTNKLQDHTCFCSVLLCKCL